MSELHRPLRVAFFGLPLAALGLLHDGAELVFVALSPVEAPGRRRLSRLTTAPVVDAFDFDDADAFSREVDARLAEATPDLVVSWYFTRKLTERWLAAAPLGAIGAHPSLLPRHRGPNPFYAAIDAGDRVTGVTVHRLVAAYDEGAMLLREELVIGERNAWQLARALDRPSLRLLRDAVRRIAQGETLREVAQDEALATWATEPHGEALRVDWRWPTERVLRRIRALSPVPGLALRIRDVDLFVTEAASTADFPATLLPGEASSDGARLVVRTADGAVVLDRVTVGGDEDSEEASTLDGSAIAALIGATHARRAR